MKKLLIISLFFSISYIAYCQELKPDKGDVTLSYSSAIGENFFANRMGVGYNQWITDDVGIRFGISSTDFMFRSPLCDVENKAPYSAKGKQMALKASLDYKASEKLLMSFSAYFSNMVVANNFFYTRAVNASFRYMFREDSFIDVSLTIMDSNNPFAFYNPYMPYHRPLYDYGFGGFTSFWLP